MSHITKCLSIGQIRDISSHSKDDAIAELCGMISDIPAVTDSERLLTAIMEREKIMSTGIGSGIALPHAKTSAVHDFVIAVGRCREGIDFESLDGLPVNIIVLLAAPDRKRTEFLKLIAAIGAVFNKQDFREQFLDADSPEEMFTLLNDNIDI